MLTINEWQHLINAIRKLSKSGNGKTNEKRYNCLIKFLEIKHPRIKELNTDYYPEAKK